MSGSVGGEPGLTYADAGVDIAAGEHAVELIKAHARSTDRPGVLGGIGGFGGLFDLKALQYDDPVLVSSTDGVGTKSVVAWSTGRYDTIGIDLVGTADDVAAQGADPLFFFDYLSMGRLDPEVAATIVGGVAEGCRQAGAALLGGEMSEHPQLMAAGEFDLVGFVVGAVERTRVLPRDVVVGDVLVGIESPGLRCNGYTLARRGAARSRRPVPRRAGVAGCRRHAGRRAPAPERHLRADAGGRPRRGGRARVRAHHRRRPAGQRQPDPAGRRRRADHAGRWPEPRIFAEVQRAGDVADAEMASVFNLGVGMVAALPAPEAERAIAVVEQAGLGAWVIGEIGPGGAACSCANTGPPPPPRSRRGRLGCAVEPACCQPRALLARRAARQA